MGVWYGLGTALGSMLNESGGPAIIGRGWCSQVLNELDAYVCSRCCSRRALFSGVAGYGRPVGRGGGADLVGQEQGRLAWLISGVSSLVLGG